MDNYFTGITSHLNLKPDQINHSENLTNIIENFKNHESIQRIKLANFHHRQSFNFHYVSVKEVKKELINLSSKKATRKGDIPAETINLNGTKLATSSYEKLLGILIDRNFSFDKHIKSLCWKAGQKLNVLARISNFLTHDKKRLLLNLISKSQFS